MLFSKESLKIDNPLNKLIEKSIFSVIEKSNKKYRNIRNDYYKIFHDSIDTINEILRNEWPGIFEHEERTPDKLNTFFKLLKKRNSLNNLRLLQIRSYIDQLADNTIDVSDNLQKRLTELKPLFTASESTITKASNISIREKNIINIRFNNNDSIYTNTLTLNNAEGSLIPPILEIGKVNYVLPTSNSLTVNQSQLQIRSGNNTGISTDKLYTTGIYYGSLIDTNPTLVERTTTNVENIYNDDESVFRIESYSNESIEISLTLYLAKPGSPIGNIAIYFGQCSELPILSKIEIDRSDTNGFIDITNQVSPNQIDINGNLIGDNIIRATNVEGIPNSIIKLTLAEKSANAIRLTFKVSNDIQVEYPEYEIRDELNNNILRKFNIFESLYFDDYPFPSYLNLDLLGINPVLLDQDLNLGKLVRVNNIVDKKFISIRYIEMNSVQVEDSGEYVSKLFGREKPIDSVDLYVSEFIPDTLDYDSIKYYISADSINYIQIQPSNRLSDTIPFRIVFDPRDPDYIGLPRSNSIRLKIEINNQNTGLIPRVYGYALLLREGFGA